MIDMSARNFLRNAAVGMKYEFLEVPLKQLLKLPPPAQKTIRDSVGDKLAVFPQCEGVKKLTSHAYSYRLRVGNYRVFF